MEFLADKSIQKLLLVFCLVLVLFAVYFVVVVFSNQSIKRLRRRTPYQTGSEKEPPPTGSFIARARWVVPIILAVALGLGVILISITRASR